MKPLAAILVCLVLVTLGAPAGSQQRPVIVRPEVPITTGSVPPAVGPESFGTTLLLRFWTAKGDAEVLAIELRCATPEFRAVLSRATDEGSDSFHVEGVIQPLRDRQVLIVFESAVASSGKGPDLSFASRGSAILREGAPKALVTAGDLSLNAQVTFDAEE
ncbi:MAG: hypothetical protein JW889_10585 [Verrucomicrobia bacterium]|nr:hypothetical protein [Verrucomicrobiota bacterium]